MEGTPNELPEALEGEQETKQPFLTEAEASRHRHSSVPLSSFERRGRELTEENRRNLENNADWLRERAREVGEEHRGE